MSRSWDERRNIIRAIIAESNHHKLADFSLTESEETYFRARSAKAVNRLARKASAFRAYYALPTEKPFGYVLGVVTLVVVGAAIAAAYLWLTHEEATEIYPLLSACATLAVVAVGWAVAGWISHRNTVRQNTNTLLFARFSHAPFGEAIKRFHDEFGFDLNPRITVSRFDALRVGDEDDKRAVSSMLYILNYYEFICCGILSGDLNAKIVESNIRGIIIYYFDKCEPCIKSWNAENHRTYEHLIKVRTHYREP